ncbi:MAG: Na+/H+ antiporter NhaC family protein, partial [Spirochaetaceae bacterium]|nr:Na+/H+ antiporter NhaC family protein [Spirochaetaceae bacterium]
MEHYGVWGIIPPVLTIILAFATKDVLVSLFLGILSGTLIVAQGNPFVALMNLTDIISNSLADGWNIRIFLFCGLLGGLVGLMSKTGAAGAFGKWASGKLKTTKGSQLMVFIFGLLIFIDDYFNSLTVGTVMRPISDKTKTSRAKLAYILDSTAAPVCILAPISSWVVTVMSLARGAEGFDKLGISELQFFINSIPFNIYAILTLIMVIYISVSGRDFGPMAESEKLAK